MSWLEVRIDTCRAGLEPVSALLAEHGVDGVVLDDETEFQEFLRENEAAWGGVDEALRDRERGRSRVTFYLESGAAEPAKLAEIRIALAELKAARPECAPLLMTLGKKLESADWENNWRQYYRPMEIGRRLLVIPEWERDTVCPGERVPLFLDPGLTFGTGSHATTRLCLMAIESLVEPGQTVLDLGCGSGILSIAALRLGAASAQAVDIDDKCLTVARENAELNGVDPARYSVRVGDVLSDAAFRESLGGGYDLVAANIVADVILALAPLARDFLRPGGVFLCSGIIDARAAEVAAGLRKNGWTIRDIRSADGWVSYTCE